MATSSDSVLQRWSQVSGVRAAVYAAECSRFALAAGRWPTLSNLLSDYPSWCADRLLRSAPIDAQLPWITFGAIRFLDDMSLEGKHVFEYGAGGSTLYFARRGAVVTSVEHDRSWAARVTLALQGHERTASVRCVSPLARLEPAIDPADPDCYQSSDESLAKADFRPYAEAIDAYPDQTFALVLVDGRARPSCVKHAWNKVAPGGWLMLDNSERPHYRYVLQTLGGLGWRRRDFAGATPSARQFTMTSVWERPFDFAQGRPGRR